MKMKRRKRQKYARCTVCKVWRAIREMKSDSDICYGGGETPVYRFWECKTHTPRQQRRRDLDTAAFVRRLYGPGDEQGERIAREIEESSK